MYMTGFFRYRTFLFCTACALSAISCKKLIEVPPPENQLVTATIFSNDQNATDAIRGLYIRIMSSPRSLLNGGASFYNALSSDELYRPLPLASEDAFTTNTLTSQNTACNVLYSLAYMLIYQANLAREQLTGSKTVSPSVKQQLTGEADVVRAFFYFYLVNLYGDVPLVTTTEYSTNAVLPRTPSAAVYQQIITDLKEAQTFLSPAYTTTSDPNDRSRPNRATATALLARVYLYQKDWAQAEQQATAVITDNAYRLEPNPDSVFLSVSREAIWQLQPVLNNSTEEGILFVPTGPPSSIPVYAMTKFLDSAFEPGDRRWTSWAGQHSTATGIYRYPYKYKAGVLPSPFKEYNTVLRLAEQYLIRAEARAWQGRLPEAAADLNIIRQRAGLTPVVVTDQASLLTAIYHERQVELFAEWGHRWLDLQRTGLSDAILGKEKPGWKAQAILYPIPNTEIQHNSMLTQNPGY
jgi:hypothetical protein